jgi:hypothetical protein
MADYIRPVLHSNDGDLFLLGLYRLCRLHGKEYEMISSEMVDVIYPALIKAQSEMGNAVKNCSNPFYKSKYADLNQLIDISKDVLFNNGMALIQSPGGSDTTASVSARIIHSSGQWLEGTITVPLAQNNPQQACAAITYARRSQLAAIFNIAQEDDDGNYASDKVKDDTKEYTDLKNALTDYINAGTFEHPDNVEIVIKAKDITKMKAALAVAKGKK